MVKKYIFERLIALIGLLVTCIDEDKDVGGTVFLCRNV